jgi:hypothetical protein
MIQSFPKLSIFFLLGFGICGTCHSTVGLVGFVKIFAPRSTFQTENHMVCSLITPTLVDTGQSDMYCKCHFLLNGAGSMGTVSGPKIGIGEINQ